MSDQHQTPSLVDVAKLAGVSPTTVSRVLNNRGYLSQHTKDRVAQAISKGGTRRAVGEAGGSVAQDTGERAAKQLALSNGGGH